MLILVSFLVVSLLMAVFFISRIPKEANILHGVFIFCLGALSGLVVFCIEFVRNGILALR
jgi:hypothetical protein